MEARLTMSEALQHAVLTQYLENKLALDEACDRLGVHRTTLWRKCQRLQEQGPQGLAHRLRGQASNAGEDPAVKKAVLNLFEKDYQPHGFRVAHFYQEASDRFPKPVSYSTVVRWLKAEGLTQKAHKGWKHRSRRPRREAFGEMLQMDTSIHDWLGWDKNIALVSNMDDCTNVICGAHLTYTDTTLANMTVLKQTILSYGLFASLYVDRSAVFKVTRTGGRGRIQQPTYDTAYTTQVERSLDELGIELLYAYSPQAKGRIERSFQTWQSRLIPELKKQGIRELEKANSYIREVFVPRYNERFADNPQKYPSAFVPLRLPIDLDRILAERYELTVGNDHIVSSKQAGLKLKILPSAHRLSYAKAKVTVYKQTSGQIQVRYQDELLNFEPYEN
jgi:transposase